jgi:small GTP-binding protein
MKTINFENFIFHFYKDSKFPNLLYVITTNLDFNPKEINCKIRRIVSVFLSKYSTFIDKFGGDITPFKTFEDTLIEMKITQKKCGDSYECTKCPFSAKKSQLTNDFKENKKVIVSLLNNLLVNLIYEVHDLIAALVVDLDGLIIVQQSVKEFDEEIIESIISIVEPSIEKIKKFSETSFGSGILDTNEFRLFYLELGGSMPVLLVFVIDPYSNIDNIVPFCYIIAEKISLILNNRSTSLLLPKLLEGGELEFKLQGGSFAGKNMIYQILLIGADRCGKSSFINMYINGIFEKDYKTTIGISIVEKELQITKKIKITFLILDMGGLKSFAKVRKFYYKISKAKAILILFDYTRIESLEKINEWLEEARFFTKSSSIQYILIGNKIDLIENRDEIRQKAEIIANQNNCLFFETSALTGEGIDEIFTYIAFNCEI